MRKLLTVVGISAILCLAGCGGGSGSSQSGQGGTLRATYNAFPDYLDPALSYTLEGWTAMWNTYIPLLTYAHANGTAGSEIIPGLAKALPKVSADGLTYTLFLRQGLKYSDGTPVRASDFTHAVERTFKLNSPGSGFYTHIVGGERFAETKKGGIPGIETDDKTGEIVIHLVEPRGTFSNELAMLFVAPLPPGTPAEDLSPNPPPATGPYEIVKSQPGQGWEYERNPQWLKNNAKLLPQLPSGHVDKIDVTVIRNPSTEVNDIEQGKFDWMQNPPPPGRYADVKAKYEGSQFRVEHQINLFYFWMNTRRPPFDDVKVRQAVNYAVDSAALERIFAGQLEGLQQILPPNMPGHEPFVLYPHDMAKAKAMVRQADPADRKISVWTNSFGPNKEAGEYYESVLGELGFEPTLKILTPDNYFTVIGNLSTPNLDTGFANWLEDYPHPSDYFATQLIGAAIQPTNNSNWAQFDDPPLTRKVERLGRELLGPKQEAEYAALDKAYMRQAPWAPFGTLTFSTFVSDAVNLDKVIWSPILGTDLSSFQFK
ncbi:MAG: peptide/nickel transport system substrate-binding protein [Solirubrobacterales bacterium]|nr:peptide/nickel transport system substrate-binding protein [Solirubrobacterales bacterium]